MKNNVPGKRTQVIYLTCIILYKFLLINEQKIKEGKLHAMSDNDQDYQKLIMESARDCTKKTKKKSACKLITEFQT